MPVFTHREKPLRAGVVVARKVCCADCAFVDEIAVKNSLGDGFCPESDTTIVGYGNNGRSVNQPRSCPKFREKGTGRNGFMVMKNGS